MDKKEKRRAYDKTLRQIKKETQENVSEEMSQFLRRRQKDKQNTGNSTAKKQQQRNNFRNNLKMNVDVGNSEYYLGCTIYEFKKYIESKWKPRMNWENMNYDGWHLEHIKPLFLFDLGKEEEKKQAGHYTNLQPMWSKDHKVKTKLEKQMYKDQIVNSERKKSTTVTN